MKKIVCVAALCAAFVLAGCSSVSLDESAKEGTTQTGSYATSGDAITPEALAAGVLRARICTLFYAMLAFSHGVAAVCRGAGYSKVPMFIMLGTWCIFRVAYIETVVHLHGSIALVFWAYPIT
ncbi:MAG TPA: hypothetical protein DD376_05695, partial [Sutterella sp.]|nr:hypothetical protein [Sutterella sp.]